MVWMGVDLGNARVGIAFSDPELTMAFPYDNLMAAGDYFSTLPEVVRLVEQHDVDRVIVGYPLLLNGSEGHSAKKAKRWARQLGKRLEGALADSSVPIPVVLHDERLTTVMAHRDLSGAGRDSRQHRSVVDQQSAVLILQSALDRRHMEDNNQRRTSVREPEWSGVCAFPDKNDENPGHPSEKADNEDSYEEFIRQGIDADFLDKLFGRGTAERQMREESDDANDGQ